MIKTCDFYNNLYCSYILYQENVKRQKGEEYLKKAKTLYSKISQQLDAEIGSNTYNKLQELLDKFDQLISATKIKSTTTSSSRA
jgi:lysine/ornithine N-monooxygenase